MHQVRTRVMCSSLNLGKLKEIDIAGVSSNIKKKRSCWSFWCWKRQEAGMLERGMIIEPEYREEPWATYSISKFFFLFKMFVVWQFECPSLTLLSSSIFTRSPKLQRLAPNFNFFFSPNLNQLDWLGRLKAPCEQIKLTAVEIRILLGEKDKLESSIGVVWRLNKY